METKNQLISNLISTQLLTQKQSLRKELNPDCEELNEKIRLRRRTWYAILENKKHKQLHHLVAQLKIQYNVTTHKI